MKKKLLPIFIIGFLAGIAFYNLQEGFAMTQKSKDPKVSKAGEQCALPLNDAELKKLLTPEQYAIARGKGTERSFCGTLLDNKRHGVYACICCGLPLFTSKSTIIVICPLPAAFNEYI